METETISLDGSSEREEGEIIDDDLEAISDDSIIATPNMGKSSTQKGNLRALSLSSVSDVEVVEYLRKPGMKRRKRRKNSTTYKRRRISKHHNRHRPKSESSSDSDENVSLTKKLLQEAIRIDKKDAHSNSLRTRLRGMVKESRNEDDVEITSDILRIPSPINSIVGLENNPENQKTPVETKDTGFHEFPVGLDQDSELIELRLAALKTAVINKYQHRKKRNIDNSLHKTNHSDINKENSSDNVNTHIISEHLINCVDEITENNDAVGNSINNSEEDEDEDILRAVLLASIAKKITNKVITPMVKCNRNKESSMTSNAPTKMIKTQITCPVVSKPKSDLNIPKIPRFIISVNNSDSNSDDNTQKENIQGSKVPEVASNITHIQQEVENEVEKFLKQQRAEVEANQKPSSRCPTVKTTAEAVAKTKVAERNSIYKLLPKCKQLEYEKLIQKLKSAEKKKPRMKRLPNKISESRSPKYRTQKNQELSNMADTKIQRNGELQRTLKDMQTQINGRLQIKGKYHILTPLLRKMNEASQEQKRHEIRIKHLLNQLKEARNQCQKSQQTFNEIVTEFFKKKEEIDKRISKENIISKQPVTSTPQCTKIEKRKIISSSHAPKTLLLETLNSRAPQETIECKIILEKCPADLTDPNDIEFKKLKSVERVTASKYISPLDNKVSSSNKINPLEIFCPFEINGFCRDKECSFNHCNQNV